jgi:hypothetical protein
MKISFTSKETYLQWRKDWKIAYAELSQKIRDLKFIRRMQCRVSLNTEAEQARLGQLVKMYALQHSFSVYYEIARCSREATELINLRAESKLEAQGQWRATKGLPPEEKPVKAAPVKA